VVVRPRLKSTAIDTREYNVYCRCPMAFLTEDDRRFAKVAGVCALCSGVVWIIWAVVNVTTNGGSHFGSRELKAFDLLTPAWNLLLIPAALAFRSKQRHESLSTVYALCGVLSLTFWAYGAATHQITPTLETTYLWLAALWWIGIGLHLAHDRRAFGLFTFVLGLVTALDGTFSIFEPLPKTIYLLAAPKLPMAAIWSFWAGVVLTQRSRPESFQVRSASN
jgi:hypothetical protein